MTSPLRLEGWRSPPNSSPVESGTLQATTETILNRHKAMLQRDKSDPHQHEARIVARHAEMSAQLEAMQHSEARLREIKAQEQHTDPPRDSPQVGAQSEHVLQGVFNTSSTPLRTAGDSEAHHGGSGGELGEGEDKGKGTLGRGEYWKMPDWELKEQKTASDRSWRLYDDKLEKCQAEISALKLQLRLSAEDEISKLHAQLIEEQKTDGDPSSIIAALEGELNSQKEQVVCLTAKEEQSRAQCEQYEKKLRDQQYEHQKVQDGLIEQRQAAEEAAAVARQLAAKQQAGHEESIQRKLREAEERGVAAAEEAQRHRSASKHLESELAAAQQEQDALRQRAERSEEQFAGLCGALGVIGWKPEMTLESLTSKLRALVSDATETEKLRIELNTRAKSTVDTGTSSSREAGGKATTTGVGYTLVKLTLEGNQSGEVTAEFLGLYARQIEIDPVTY